MTINPTVLKIGTTKDWCFKSIEKKRNELKNYLFKLNQIQNFILIFFYHYGLKSYFIRLFYSKTTLHIYISHSYSSKSFNKKIIFKTPYKSVPFLLKILNITFLLKLKRYLKIKHLKLARNDLINNVNFKFCFSIKKLNIITLTHYLKKKLKLKNVSSMCNFFLKKIFVSLNHFFDNKTFLYLTVKFRLKPNFNKQCLQSDISHLSFNLLRLKKFEKTSFFKASLTMFVKYIMSFSYNYASNIAIFAQFYIEQLNNYKHLNFLLNFIKNIIKCFVIKTLVNGVIIEIRGNLSKNPRATNKLLKIGQTLSRVKIHSKIDFCESVCYTKKGTFGIKVFVH
jgi:hypothetical protein